MMKRVGGSGLLAAAALMLASVCGAGSASAQALVTAAGDNPTLQSLGQNIVSICPRIQSGTGDLGDLAQRCTAAVRAANAGDAITARSALGQIAAEELIAQDAQVSGAVRPQTEALAARIAALGGAGPARQISAGLQLPFIQATATDAAPASGGRVGRWDGFATAFLGWGEQDANALEAGFDADGWSILAGADYAISDTLFVGGALGYSRTEVEFSGSQGDLENDGWTLAGYGSWSGAGGFYASGVAAYSFIDYESNRNISYTEPARPASGASPALPAVTVNRTARGETDATQYEVSARGGYVFDKGAFAYGPSMSSLR